jgi:hypothetical protein
MVKRLISEEERNHLKNKSKLKNSIKEKLIQLGFTDKEIEILLKI